MARARCILLFSGGLDSLLAAKLLIQQNIEVVGLHCILPYFSPELNPDLLPVSTTASQIGLKLIHYKCDENYISMLKSPKHGYGKHINPCIDCKIFFINIAFQMMQELSADFIATGEVLGQRPMSQQKNILNHIENSTIKGKLLRPLSALLLKPTIPELAGMVDRSKLLDINGRGRFRQIQLAKSFELQVIPSPAGGCLFTDQYISSRIKDLIKYHPDFNQIDLYLTTLGRHYRINNELKIIVARNEQESIQLEKYSKNSDYIIQPEFKGPNILIKGNFQFQHIDLILSIISRFGKPTCQNNISRLVTYNYSSYYKYSGYPIDDVSLSQMRI